MNIFQQYIYKSRYSRYLDEKNRREHWNEVTERYINYVSEKIEREYNLKIDEELKKRLYNSILNLEVMPSMRAMMTAGEALERDNTSSFNCLRGDTLVTTKEYGAVPILELENKKVHVIDGNGEWVLSECKSYGEQEILEVMFKTDSHKLPYYVYTTANHRWIMKDGKEKTTSQLIKGDELFTINFSENKYSDTVYKVENVENLFKKSKVYCFEVPTTKSFMLTRNLLTGNCSALAIDDPKAFDEAMFILMSGCGVGFSVERQFINLLPEIPEKMFDTDTTIKVKDSKEGWAKALRMLISLLYAGEIPKWDLSLLRPAGARLKIFGGRCLSYDTVVYKDRKRNRECNEITLGQLYDMKNSLGFWKHKPNHFKKVKIRSLNENTGEFFRNKILDIYDNGIKNVFEVITESGYRIEATKNHKFMKETGEWQELKYFKEGDFIAVNGSIEKKTGICIDCDINISRRSVRCKNCSDLNQRKIDCLDTTARQRKEARTYRKNNLFCELCSMSEDEKRLEIHHIDGNPHNNNENNLLCLCPSCHRKEDMKRIYFGNSYSCKYLKYDVIKLIKYVGKKQTYDLEMEGPNHNFIANGFVSHNSSGPAPLNDLFEFVVRIFKNAKGRKLTSIECHDIMCKIGEIVVTGGVRRSALISLSNLSDDRMRHAKSGEWWKANVQRALSNNSAVYTEKPEPGSFMSEWLSLYESKSGERGIVNRQALRNFAKRTNRRKHDYEFLVNPCVPYETLVLTDKGYYPIGDLENKEVSVWNGKEFSLVRPYMTAKNQETVVVSLSDGSSLECTPYHMWILEDNSRKMACELKQGDKLAKFDMPVIEEGQEYPIHAYSQGFYSGDGIKGKPYSYIYEPKYKVLDRVIGKLGIPDDYSRVRWTHGPMFDAMFVPIDGTKKYCLDWLAGLLDADGTVLRYDNSCSIQLSSINLEFLENVRLMLTRLGVQAKINKSVKSCYKIIKNKEYFCQDVYRLLINSADTCLLLDIGLNTNRLQFNKYSPNRDARRFVFVKSVEYTDEIKDVYCFDEPKNHSGTFNGIVTGQCSEIILRPMEMCNLSEVVVRSEDTEETLMDKIEVAAIFGTFQSCFTHFPYLRKTWQKNCEEERLLGVSLTGIYDNKLLNNYKDKDLPNRLEKFKQHAINVNKEWAEKLGINQSVSVTTVKPSGTISSLVLCSSGIHPGFDYYYIRRVRADNKDPLTEFLKLQGVPSEPDVTKPNDTTIFSFPMKLSKDSVIRDNVNAQEQLELYLIYQKHWTEHKPSITIYVKEDEWPRIGGFIYDNFDEISGVSFLPFDGGNYKQAPYESITKEEYEKLEKEMIKDINWDLLVEYDDNVEGVQTLACHGNICEIL